MSKEKIAEDSDKPNSKYVIPYLALYRYASGSDKVLMVVGIIFSVLMGVTLPLFTIVFGDVLNKFLSLTPDLPEVLKKSILNDINTSIVYLCLIGLGAFVSSYISMCFWMLSGENQTKRIREKYLQAILRQEMSWFDSHPSGDLVSRITSDINLIQEGISEKATFVVQYLVTFITGFIVAYTKGPKLSLALTAVIPLLATSAAVLSKILGAGSKKGQDAFAEASTIAEESIAAIRTVSSISAQEYFSAKFVMKLEKAYKEGIKMSFAKGIGIGTVFFLLFCSYSLAFYYGSILIENGEMHGGDVVNVFFAIIMGAFSIGHSAPHFASFGKARGAATNIFETIERKSNIASDSKEGIKLNSVKGEIEFKNVNFFYPSRPDVQVLKDFSLKIPAGKTVALVGQSGSGKSTTVQLIERFYDAVSGSITLDGVDVTTLNVKWLREQIGIVSQEPVLFNKSIMQNVLWGILGIEKGKHITNIENLSSECKTSIKNACISANADDFISKLPSGYDTVVGQKGGQLSGGQKQRVAIARAILKDPPILLLDEATSALDTESERIVQSALDNASQNRTTLVIAHRLSTIKNADIIVVMEKGVIKEQGTHEELMNRVNGHYRKLVLAQEIRQLNDDDQKDGSLQEDVESSILSDVELTRQVSKSSKRSTKEEENLEVILAEKSLKSFGWGRIMEHLEAFDYMLIAISGFASMLNGAVMPLYAIVLSNILETFGKVAYDIVGFRKGSNYWSLMFLLLALMAFVVNFIENWLSGIGGERLSRRLRKESFYSIMRQHVGFFDDPLNATGILTAKLSTDATLVHGLSGPLLSLVFRTTAAVAVGLGIAFAYGWKLTLVVLSIMPLIMIAGFFQMRTLKGASSKIKQQYEASAEIVTEAIDNIRTVAMLTMEQKIASSYFESVVEPHKEARKSAWVSSIGYAISQGILFWAYAVAFAYGSYLLLHREMTSADMFHVMFSVIFVSMSLGQTSSMVPDFAKAKVAAGGIYELIDSKSAIDYHNPDGNRPENPNGDINVENLSFSYPNRPDLTVLEGMEFVANPGTTVALVGHSGSGKSTIISLLERFYDSTKGEIYMDGVPLPKWNLVYLRQQMALVGQEPVLFSGTIKENIGFGLLHDEVTDAKIENAAKLANIYNFIMSLPDGFNTNIGEKGTQLSGGQKQRIAIARALIRNPRVLLLDEATSALDSESEKVVQEALDKASEGRTTIVVAHRLSTIQNAQQILYVNKGVIAEKGTHEELLRQNGLYASLVEKQTLTK